MVGDRRNLVRSMIESYNDARFDDFATPFGAAGVLDFPQSGESVTGADAIAVMYGAYPVTPPLRVTDVRGSGPLVAVDFATVDPGGDEWRGLLLAEFGGEVVVRLSVYFFPAMPAPDWRAPFVDRSTG